MFAYSCDTLSFMTVGTIFYFLLNSQWMAYISYLIFVKWMNEWIQDLCVLYQCFIFEPKGYESLFWHLRYEKQNVEFLLHQGTCLSPSEREVSDLAFRIWVKRESLVILDFHQIYDIFWTFTPWSIPSYLNGYNDNQTRSVITIEWGDKIWLNWIEI